MEFFRHGVHRSRPVALPFRYNTPRMMSRICVALLVIAAGCARNVPVPPPPNVVQPDWDHVTKASGCVVNDALPDPACTPGNINPAV